nr:prolyl oligopeptidase family serine peptidase [Oceanococcus sp. HetDA_MAG_MS8]
MTTVALLYLHGLGSSGNSDTGQFLEQHFGQTHRVLRPDYRPQFFVESVQAIDRWIQQLGEDAERVAILGSSMGGWQALHALARHPQLQVLALNPVLAPAALATSAPPDQVDHRSGDPLPWPQPIRVEDFPPAPLATLPAQQLRVLIGRHDDVVPPQPTIDACATFDISHRVLPWGHRAEFGSVLRDEVAELLGRSQA